MRITNIDTLSAYIDRLITEHIKLYFFRVSDKTEQILHQEKVIFGIRKKIARLFHKIYKSGKYKYQKEFRTFDEDSLLNAISELVTNDIRIGEADRARLSEAKSEEPDFYRAAFHEFRLRVANEGRAKNKNEIDRLMSLKDKYAI